MTAMSSEIDAGQSQQEAIKKLSNSVQNHWNASTFTAGNTIHMTSASQSDSIMNETDAYTTTNVGDNNAVIRTTGESVDQN